MDTSSVRAVAGAIVSDYQKGRAIDKMTLSNQPDKEAIIDVLDRLFGILYMGYFRDRTLKLYDPETGLSVMVEDAIYRLQKQVLAVLPFSDKCASLSRDAMAAESERITLAFFARIPAVRALMDTDLQAILDGDPAASNKDEIIFSYPGYYTITVHRLAHELFQLGVPMIPRIMSEHAHSKTGIDIHPGATIGAYFMIDHGTGIVVGETCVIGEHVKLYQGVTLGALSTSGGQSLRGVRRHPTVEDYVTIYANAAVLGNTVIGSHSVIGGSVFITSNVPANTRVVMQPQDLEFREKKH